MTEAMKLCKDCSNCQLDQFGELSYAKCRAIPSTDLVTGVTRPVYCSTARYAGQSCGPEGKLFEPKVAV